MRPNLYLIQRFLCAPLEETHVPLVVRVPHFETTDLHYYYSYLGLEIGQTTVTSAFVCVFVCVCVCVSGPEKFWAYRWVHAVDGTTDSPFILEIFSSSQPEIFNNICPSKPSVHEHIHCNNNFIYDLSLALQ